MRVAIVTGIFPPDIGGPATHAADLATWLAEGGHQGLVVTLTDERRVQRRREFVGYPRRWPWPLRLAAVALWLVRHRRRYDVVYATGLHPAATAGARLARRPIVAKVVGDPVWERARRQGLVTAGFEPYQSGRAGSVRATLMRWLRDWSLTAADAVVAPSEYLARVVGGWVGEEVNVRVIPNGVRAPITSAIHRRSTGRLSALFVGRLVDHKHVDVLLRAIADSNAVTLDIIGEGPERDDLEKLTASLGITDRVRFHGTADHGTVLKRVADSDVLVLASGYEGLPHVVIEALACGTPVIAPAVGGVTEALHDRKAGLVVDPTPVGVAQGLAALRDDGELWRRLSVGASAAGEKWRFDQCATQLLDLFGDYVDDDRPPVVFVGRAGLPASGDLETKFRVFARHVRATVVTVDTPSVRRVCDVRVIAFPEVRPRLLAGLLFYVFGFVPAFLFAGGSRGAIVTQSPFEGVLPVAAARLLPRRLRPKVIVEVRGDWRTAARLYGNPARKVIAPLADRLADWAVLHADWVRTIGSYTRSLVLETGRLDDVGRVTTFNNFAVFLDPDPVPPPAAPRALFAGALESTKGLDVLLEAWPAVVARIPEATLTIAGGGSQKHSTIRRIDALGLAPSVELVGDVGRSEVRRLLDDCRLLVLPSRSEGLGRIAKEAHARARPVVASRVGGIPEIVTHDVTGLLVASEDPDSLAAAIVSLLGDPNSAARFGSAGRARVLERNALTEFEDGIAELASWVDSQTALE